MSDFVLLLKGILIRITTDVGKAAVLYIYGSLTVHLNLILKVMYIVAS
jgi:hypothetical protein